jgi:cytochrome c peroxidase
LFAVPWRLYDGRRDCFSDTDDAQGIEFNNNGLYNLPGKFSYPEDNLGLYDFTRDPKDVGKFRAPSLRNVAVRPPYMHDGSDKDLDAVLAHYVRGGRLIEHGPLAGDGAKNPNKTRFVGDSS